MTKAPPNTRVSVCVYRVCGTEDKENDKKEASNV